jgi:hypothetical protein
MGENWILRFTPRSDLNAAMGHCNFARREILIEEADEPTMLSTILHEVMHRAIDQHSEEPANELRVEWSARCVLEFLEKSGVDLGPLVRGMGLSKKHRQKKR